DAQRRIGLFIDHYNFQRPHQGIDGLVPADRFFGAAPEVLRTLRARVAASRRGGPGSRPGRAPRNSRAGSRPRSGRRSTGGPWPAGEVFPKGRRARKTGREEDSNVSQATNDTVTAMIAPALFLRPAAGGVR